MMEIRLAPKRAKSTAELEAIVDPVAAMADATHNPIGNSPQGKALSPTAWIQHRILTMAFVANDVGVVIGTPMYRVDDPRGPALGTNVHDHAKSIYDDLAVWPFPAGGRYDIDLPNFSGAAQNHQRWLVLELDPRIQWSFTPGDLAVSARDNHPDEDYDIYFVDKNKAITGPGGVAPPDCRVVFWAIMERAAGSVNGGVRKFNYHVQIEDIVNPKDGPLVTIIDPSIPNTGGGTIP